MPITKERDSDENDDRVRIRLGQDQDVRIVEQYSFHCSILQQPSIFNIHLSGGHGAAEVLDTYLAGGPCSLSIGKYRQFTGEIDAPNASGDEHSTTVQLVGRDMMARLHDQDIPGERSFDNATYEQLVKAALADVGQGHKIIEISNTANRQIRSGTNVKVFKEPVTVSEVKQSPSGGASAKFRNVVTAKMGETWLEFLERHFAKLGLFLWSDAYGNFVLSRPNGSQDPTFHFYRKRGEAKSIANVKSFSFTNDTTRRFCELVIFARNLGRKAGHNHTNGGFRDEEMLDLLQYVRRKVYRDVNVNSPEEAQFYARRQIAEVNRASWKLQYVISGHSAPTMQNRAQRAVIVPDMVARVDDDELDIHENLYIESVEYRSPPRTTVVTMMRPQDLIFGENQAIDAVPKIESTVRKAKRRRKGGRIDFTRTKPNANTNMHLAPGANVGRSPPR